MSGATKLCACFIDDKKYYPQIAAASNFPVPPECPFPKVRLVLTKCTITILIVVTISFQGKYAIRDFSVGEDFLPIMIPTGDYVVIVNFLANDEIIFGYKVTSTVSAK